VSRLGIVLVWAVLTYQETNVQFLFTILRNLRPGSAEHPDVFPSVE